MRPSKNSPADSAGSGHRERATLSRWSARHGRLRWQAAVVAVLAVVVVVFGAIVTFGGGPTPQPGDPSLGVHALENLSSFEKQVLADKHVTASELDDARQHYRQCLTDAGIRYETEPGSTGMSQVWLLGGPANGWPAGSEQDFDDAMQRCTDEVSAVQNVWTLQTHEGGSDPQPLPGLKEALENLDTPGW